MSEVLTTVIADASTGEVIEREMTAEEIADHEEIEAAALAAEAERQAKIAARESALAKLAALGLTQEEIDAL
jgi:hypothetical protein